ncbi:lipolytic protein G-D-S-L family [Mucilaginibacter sp. PPCGB 2223]|uniref:GDSL-type esterase/lipase family protein n=1 Tax=Mucilaginibacter sp. PPCGB 2223 TaxID=1886027 RepID=UPI00082477D4|nr:GDSL-type esterase/lipase family protein [Mucilaginibacter sp. PPCGB 2223]OCX53289.1 lipolytic protein G-D-S-L family [Mucilaginibacter sp. PPCGB 2223]
MKNRNLAFWGIVALALCSFALREKPSINVVFIGDSITHGTTQKDETPPNYTDSALVQSGKFKTVQVANQGISGYTTVDFLPATHKSYPKVRAAADAFYTDKQAMLVFSIMLGTNDSAIKGPTGSPVSPQDYHANLKTIADSLLAAYPTCKIVINHPIWYSNNTHNRGAAYMQEGQDRVLLYHKEIDALVKEYAKINPHHVYLGDTKGYKYFDENHLTDFKAENGLDGVFYLHPNKKGDITLGKFWCDAIIRALK